MPTKEQGKQFRAHLFEIYMKPFIESSIPVLSTTIDFINENMEPDEVFDVIRLRKWAEANGYVNPMVKVI